MKKAFYIVTVVENLMVLPTIWLMADLIIFYFSVKHRTDLGGLFLIILVNLIPLISLLIGWFKDKKSPLSKTYMATFLVVNSIIALISILYFYIAINWSM